MLLVNVNGRVPNVTFLTVKRHITLLIKSQNSEIKDKKSLNKLFVVAF